MCRRVFGLALIPVICADGEFHLVLRGTRLVLRKFPLYAPENAFPVFFYPCAVFFYSPSRLFCSVASLVRGTRYKNGALQKSHPDRGHETHPNTSRIWHSGHTQDTSHGSNAPRKHVESNTGREHTEEEPRRTHQGGTTRETLDANTRTDIRAFPFLCVAKQSLLSPRRKLRFPLFFIPGFSSFRVGAPPG